MIEVLSTHSGQPLSSCRWGTEPSRLMGRKKEHLRGVSSRTLLSVLSGDHPASPPKAAAALGPTVGIDTCGMRRSGRTGFPNPLAGPLPALSDTFVAAAPC